MTSRKQLNNRLIISVFLCGIVTVSSPLLAKDDLNQEYVLLKKTLKDLQYVLSIKCNKIYKESFLIKNSSVLKHLLAKKALMHDDKMIDQVLFRAECPIEK
jgi:hypothetical protein